MVLLEHVFDFIGHIFYNLNLGSLFMLSKEMIVELPIFERIIFVVHKLNNQSAFF
jgi:hypothetical protein